MTRGNRRWGALVHQATGVLMTRDGITSEQALHELQTRADATGQSVLAVAADVVRATTKDIDDDDDKPADGA